MTFSSVMHLPETPEKGRMKCGGSDSTWPASGFSLSLCSSRIKHESNWKSSNKNTVKRLIRQDFRVSLKFSGVWEGLQIVLLRVSFFLSVKLASFSSCVGSPWKPCALICWAELREMMILMERMENKQSLSWCQDRFGRGRREWLIIKWRFREIWDPVWPVNKCPQLTYVIKILVSRTMMAYVIKSESFTITSIHF